jgi:elongation factor 1-gamma
MKLYNNHHGNIFTDVAYITSQLAKVTVEEVFVNDEEAKSKEFKQKSLTGKFPFLETEEGSIFESAAIARYLARKNPESKIGGANAFEQAQIDQWIDFSISSAAPHMRIIYASVFGLGPVDMDIFNNAVKDLKEALKVVNTHLQGKEFLVGNTLTIADLVLTAYLVIPFQVALDPGFRKAMPNVTSWFEKTIKLPEVVRRFGNVKLCQKTIKPVAPPKEKAQPKPQAAAKPKDDGEEGEKKEKKEGDPLDSLPPSSFNLFDFKTFYVNHADKKGEAMKFFFDNYDPAGYTTYFLRY